MPVGILRLNAKRSQPNRHIVFIKPLKGPDEDVAQKFLERIAAQCVPVMREHHLSVITLEEYEPNREFVGRNFNAGEVIQLVLKSPGSGRWLPFSYVQMVMMHELAHCEQMNHSRAFWAVRNSYAAQMQGLWARGYTGEGIWGRGARLETGAWESNVVRPDDALPEHLCGGTYRSRRGKRKKATKPTLTYRERKERRIEKKFGKDGMALGADEEVKSKLEKGKRVQGKPRVAGSARGRELRAAAALARFGEQKPKQEVDVATWLKREDGVDVGTENEPASGSETASGSESDYEYDDANDGGGGADAVDIKGVPLRDGRGRHMVRVCEGEGDEGEDPSAKDEMEELRGVLPGRNIKREPSPGDGPSIPPCVGEAVKREPLPDGGLSLLPRKGGVVKREPSPDEVIMPRHVGEQKDATTRPRQPVVKREPIENESPSPSSNRHAPPRSHQRRDEAIPESDERAANKTAGTGEAANHASTATTGSATKASADRATCEMCSFTNAVAAPTCAMCAHVLDATTMRNSWRCDAPGCSDSRYINSGDCGVCGLCGRSRQR